MRSVCARKIMLVRQCYARAFIERTVVSRGLCLRRSCCMWHTATQNRMHDNWIELQVTWDAHMFARVWKHAFNLQAGPIHSLQQLLPSATSDPAAAAAAAAAAGTHPAVDPVFRAVAARTPSDPVWRALAARPVDAHSAALLCANLYPLSVALAQPAQDGLPSAAPQPPSDPVFSPVAAAALTAAKTDKEHSSSEEDDASRVLQFEEEISFDANGTVVSHGRPAPQQPAAAAASAHATQAAEVQAAELFELLGLLQVRPPRPIMHCACCDMSSSF